MSSRVTTPAAASSEAALAHFEKLRQLETDCWDVNECITNGSKDFILLDVRSPAVYRKSHITTAVNLPHSDINESSLAEYSNETLFVVYCSGPHCNGADRAAIKLAQLQRPVKKMIGGVSGWLDEGFALETSSEAA